MNSHSKLCEYYWDGIQIIVKIMYENEIGVMQANNFGGLHFELLGKKNIILRWEGR